MLVKYCRYLFILISIVFLYTCRSYETTIESSRYGDDTIREVLLNVEKNQRDAEYFAKLGQNRYANYLNILLCLCALFTGIATVIEGSKLWRKTAKPRLITLLILSISAAGFSSTGLYIKSESDRFFKENRDKYTLLSLQMDETIMEFYLNFRRGNFNDNSIKQPEVRDELLSLSERTLKMLSFLRKDFNEKYRINTNPTYERP